MHKENVSQSWTHTNKWIFRIKQISVGARCHYKFLSRIKLITLKGDNFAFAKHSKYKQDATCHREAAILRGIAGGILPVFSDVMKQLEHRRHQGVGPSKKLFIQRF
jgi:hypothetical protein